MTQMSTDVTDGDDKAAGALEYPQDRLLLLLKQKDRNAHRVMVIDRVRWLASVTSVLICVVCVNAVRRVC